MSMEAYLFLYFGQEKIPISFRVANRTAPIICGLYYSIVAINSS